ncbi:hypothetical protein GGR57DRAFT_461729 [Xylariaceae sp. FL1272]|nr:hypothetical protein GGR57DRAFT_461729 [Xylariaceae sp. FL1272]
MIRTITLTALVLRFTISVQAAVCTSMIAALSLEGHETRMSDAAYFSIIRGINDGLSKLCRRLIRSRRRGVSIELLVACYLLIVTVALQFSSTILLSDVHDFVMIGDTHSAQVQGLLLSPYAPDTVNSGLSMNAWSPVYVTFGEVDGLGAATPDELGLSDSGLLQRAFLPFSDSLNRTAVRFFEGNAMVMNSRVACMRPVMTASLGIGGIPYDNHTYGNIQGVLDLQGSLRDATDNQATIACNTTNCQTMSFDCDLPSKLISDRDSQTSFCQITKIGGPLQDFITDWNTSDKAWAPDSFVYLSFVTNMTFEDWNMLSDPLPIGAGVPSGEWNTYATGNSSYVTASLCFSANKMQRQTVQMSTAGNTWEPQVDWSLTAPDSNTSAVQRSFGVDPNRHTFQDRGILDMIVKGSANDGPPSSAGNDIFPDLDRSGRNFTRSGDTSDTFDQLNNEGLWAGGVTNASFSGCESCFINTVITHKEFESVWRDIISATNRPVQALQARKTMMASTIFQRYQSSLGQTEEARITQTKLVETPGSCFQHGCAGFVSVITLLFSHLLCVAVITGLYVTRIRYSRYGNIWHTVSQLITPDMANIIQQSNNKRDLVITRQMGKAADVPVKIVGSATGFSVGIRAAV